MDSIDTFDKLTKIILLLFSEQNIGKLEEYGIVKYLSVFDDVRTFLCKAHCTVLLSYYREGIPRSLLETRAIRSQ